MEIDRLIAEHGSWFYAIAFIWTFLEGETVVLFAGFAAAQGLLNPFLLVAATGLGSFAGDQSCFWIGRRFGSRLLGRFPRWRLGVEIALRWLERYNAGFILSFRFIYGVRNFSAFAMGMSAIRGRRFLMLNFLAAALWAASLHRRRLFSRPCASRRTRRRGPLVQFGDVGRVRHDRQRDRARAPAPTAASAQDTARD